ncbi:hypothetical protein Bbelb_344600 [Branchiostoma belcheri]|nr:hypothetical protein Bbelb_344600 [Branchiostoma belcheri]
MSATQKPTEQPSTATSTTAASQRQSSTTLGSTQPSSLRPTFFSTMSMAKEATSTSNTTTWLTSSEATQTAVLYCENDNRLNVEWPRTVANTRIQLTGSCRYGLIVRECRGNGQWETPDTTECRSPQAAQLLEKANTTLTKLETMQHITPNDVDMAGQLAQAMEDATNSSGGYIPTANDLQLYTNITSSLIRVFEMANDTTTSYSKLKRYAQSVVNVFSNMIAPPNREVWASVGQFTHDRCGGCSCVMEQAERLARSLARNLPPNSTFTTEREIHTIRIHIEFRKILVSSLSADLEFPREMSEFVNRIRPSPINLPVSVFQAAGDSVKAFSVYYIAYHDLQSCLPPISSGKYSGFTIQSQIVASGVDPQPQTPFQEKNVSIGHWHLTNAPNETACTWWDFETRQWTDRGCTIDVSMSNDSHTRCLCNHLTNFALLMSPFHKTSPFVSKALKYITFIGCGISFIFLLITAIAHLSLWRFVKKDSARAHIHVNLCLSLATANLVIIISEIVDPGITVLCTVIAVFLHYFYLSAMTWMLCEGVQLYMSIVHVFRRSNKIVRRAYYAVGWGAPLVIVAITIGVTQSAGYGNQVTDTNPQALSETNGTTEATSHGQVSNNNGEDEHCWLVVDNGVRWSFIGPAIFIIAVNLVIMVIVLKTMLGNRALQNAEQWTRTKAGIRASFVMLPLLGLSWLLGVFSMNEETSAAFGLLFAVVNSLQGLFIFIFHCLRSKTINDAIDKKNGKGGSFRKSNLSKTISRQSSYDPRTTMKRVKGSMLLRRLFPSKKDDRRRQHSSSGGTNSLSVPSTPPKTRKDERRRSSGFSISSLVRKLRGSQSSENAEESSSGDSGVADLNSGGKQSPDRSRRSSSSSTPHTPTTLTWGPTQDLEQPPIAPPRTKRQRASATLMPTQTLPTLVECSPYSTVNSIRNVTTTAQVEPNQVDIDFTKEPSLTSLQSSTDFIGEQLVNGNGLRRVASAPVKKHSHKHSRGSLQDTIVNIPENTSPEIATSSESPPEDSVSDYSSVFEELHEVAVRRRSLPKLEDWKNVL